MANKRPIVLTILDGFGINPDKENSAIALAKTPNLSKLMQECPTTSLSVSGLDVGLPPGQMGNSEVGHTNIGAGRVVYQDLTRISKSIDDGDFFTNKVLVEAMENCKKNNSALHLLGLVSDGGVHSHNTHLYALLSMAKDKGLQKVYIHCLLDGRDVPPDSGKGFIAELLEKIREIGIGKIATIAGRYYGMDRETRWERTKLAYDAICYGQGKFNPDPLQAVLNSYTEGVTDEFVIPVVCDKNAGVKDGDSIIFFNFRPDRARQITRAIVDPDFSGFDRKEMLKVHFVCMTEYDAVMPNVKLAFDPVPLTMTMGEYLSKMGKKQLRIAETTKYAHVTFFYNGGEERVFEGEDRILIPTPNVATFDLKPEMSAYEVCYAVVEQILSGKYDAIILNFANCDMVGHTGILQAAIKAVEAVDECVGRVVEATEKAGGICIITADHGNAEKMSEPDGSPYTAHTTNPVPFIVKGIGCKLKPTGRLADISPTMLELMGLPKPNEMEGESLITEFI